jgi:hypothetical protein
MIYISHEWIQSIERVQHTFHYILLRESPHILTLVWALQIKLNLQPLTIEGAWLDSSYSYSFFPLWLGYKLRVWSGFCFFHKTSTFDIKKKGDLIFFWKNSVFDFFQGGRVSASLLYNPNLLLSGDTTFVLCLKNSMSFILL